MERSRFLWFQETMIIQIYFCLRMRFLSAKINFIYNISNIVFFLFVLIFLTFPKQYTCVWPDPPNEKFKCFFFNIIKIYFSLWFSKGIFLQPQSIINRRKKTLICIYWKRISCFWKQFIRDWDPCEIISTGYRHFVIYCSKKLHEHSPSIT